MVNNKPIKGGLERGLESISQQRIGRHIEQQDDRLYDMFRQTSVSGMDAMRSLDSMHGVLQFYVRKEEHELRVMQKIT